MSQKKWIGIQFNFSEEVELRKWLSNYDDLELETDVEHVTINLTIEDLKKSSSEIRESRIIELTTRILNEFLRYSGYTTLYGHIENPKLDKILNKIKREFKEGREITVNPSIEDKTLLEDFPFINNYFEIKRIIKSDEIYKYLNCIREKCLSEKLSSEQLELFTSIEYMDKEEWEDEIDVLRMDVKFEEKRNAA